MRISSATQEVSVVVRSDYDAVKQDGFHIQSECGDFVFHPAGVYRSAEEYPDEPDYLVLISTIGGMALFGLNGFVLGPVIAALFITAWGLYAALSQKTQTDMLPPENGDTPDRET